MHNRNHSLFCLIFESTKKEGYEVGTIVFSIIRHDTYISTGHLFNEAHNAENFNTIEHILYFDYILRFNYSHSSH